MRDSPFVSLWYLFSRFLIIGTTAFGGNMALVAVVQQRLCVEDRVIENKTLLELISLASFIPGPLAVNVVTGIGFLLRGWQGAIIAMMAVLLPSFFMMLAFAYFYADFGKLFWFAAFLDGVIPVMMSLILFTAFNLAKESVKNTYQWIIVVLAVVLIIGLKGIWVIFSIFLLSGAIALFVNRNLKINKRTKFSFKLDYQIISFLIITIGLLIIPINYDKVSTYNIGLFFSKVSLTLFGGGYVIIPILQNILVDELMWINSQDFIDAITFGQITPGPILISATFIGFKLSGFIGAIVATIGIFLPSSILMVLLVKYFLFFRHNHIIQILFKGIKPAVVGMIASSCYFLSTEITIDLLFVLIFLTSFLLFLAYYINVLLLLVAGGVLRILFNLL